MKKQFALNFLMSQMWALDPPILKSMGDIASRSSFDVDLTDLSVISPKAVEGKSGTSVTPRMEMREGGVAVIHVAGVISRYSSMFEDICGGVSTQAIAKDFAQARDDPKVKSILFNFDSPGGDANGIHELSEMIFSARGIKPIVGYIGGTGASAIYWIASACERVVIDATAMVGSIGVVASLTKYKDDESKVERLEFVSSQSPKKRLDPSTKEGGEDWQRRLDQMADVFVDRVARNMGVTVDTVLSDFGQGGVLIGQDAVDKGMAHTLGSFEQEISRLANRKSTMTNKTNQAVALPSATEASAEEVVSALTEQRPDVLEAVQGGPNVSALEHASELSATCAKLDFSELTAKLLAPGVTKASADKQIELAASLKDVCVAAGFESSLPELMACMDDPVKLVGKVIHEVQAAVEENSDANRQVVVKEKQPAKLDSQSIYEKRKAGK